MADRLAAPDAAPGLRETVAVPVPRPPEAPSARTAAPAGRSVPAQFAPPRSRPNLRPVPGNSGPPLVGYTWRYLRDPIRHWRSRYDRFGPVSWESLFGRRMLMLLGPDASGLVLENRDMAFATGPTAFIMGPFFQGGLGALDFDEHRHQRRIMLGAFSNNRMHGYLDRIMMSVDRSIAAWEPSATFVAYPALKRLTLDLATEIFVGGRLGPEADRVNAALVACLQALSAAVRYPVPGLRWSRGLAGRRYLERFLYPQVPARRVGAGTDLFTMLCQAESEEGERLTDAQVVNQMILLMLAAHDTSTITMTTITYYLARHPEWQERCRAESLALGAPGVDQVDLGRLTSLNLVMKEALRLVAPAPMILRWTVRDTEALGHFLPANRLVAVVLSFTHHMHEYWPDPERFDPERFAEHRREDRVHRYAWEPFGAGAHKCVGMHFAGLQVKAVLHQMLLRYRWSVAPHYRVPMAWSPLPVPKDGLPVRLERTG
jgi:cytochrome P450